MPDFTLITDRYLFSSTAKKIWADYSPDPMKDYLNAPHNMPCLASMFMANGAVSAVIADKKNAKRLIYPKTNRHRLGIRRFDWVDGNLGEEIDTYVNVTLGRNKLDKKSPAQAARVDELMRKIKGRKGPVLITIRIHSLEDTMVMDFFLVTKELASTLVYYNKNNTKDDKDIVEELWGGDQAPNAPNDMSNLAPSKWPKRNMAAEIAVEVPRVRPARQGDFPFFININREGEISIAAHAIFNTQTDIPRFSAGIESVISNWEILYIKHINSVLEDAQADIESTVSIAKIKCKEFLAERRLLRIKYVVKRMDSWINKNETDPEIRAIIQQHGQ